jgi:hypothetical protein
MESFRFADFLFTALTLLITFLILWLVNRKRSTTQQSVVKEDPTATDSGDERPS